MNMEGTGVALVTPFNQDLSIDVTSLQKCVDFVIDGGVDYLVVLGTTAEAATLNDDERQIVIQTILEQNADRLPVMLGIGGNNTIEIVNKIKAQSFEGISGLLSVSPYYNKPSQKGIQAHFEAIAEVSPVPIMLYNVPGRTSSNISVDTALTLANKYKNIMAIKEASGDMDQICQLIQKAPSHFKVISGDDALTLPMISVGAKGAVSVVANCSPASFSNLVRFALQHNLNEAQKEHYKLFNLIGMLFEEGSPAGVKKALEHLGLVKANLRLPLVGVSDELSVRIKNAV